MTQIKEALKDVIPFLNGNARAKQLMEVWPRVLELGLEGEEKPFYLVIDQGQMALEERVDKLVDIVISGSSKAFIDVMTGRKDVTYPIAQGELKLARENVPDMITFSRILRTLERRK